MAVGTTALLLAGGAFSATSSIIAGNAQAKAAKRQGEYNAQVYEQQASMIDEKRRIQDVQFTRNLARTRSSLISKVAGKGLMLSGSPLAVLADTESQMLFDKAIMDYNLEIDKNYALSGAGYYRQTGAAQSRRARTAGYTNAFTTMLGAGTNAAILNMGMPKVSKVGKI